MAEIIEHDLVLKLKDFLKPGKWVLMSTIQAWINSNKRGKKGSEDEDKLAEMAGARPDRQKARTKRVSLTDEDDGVGTRRRFWRCDGRRRRSCGACATCRA